MTNTLQLSKFAAAVILLAGCGVTPLQEAPEREEVLDDALPDSTEIRVDWAAPSGDTGKVDDDWLATFNDEQLDALVAEALDKQNPNLRILH